MFLVDDATDHSAGELALDMQTTGIDLENPVVMIYYEDADTDSYVWDRQTGQGTFNWKFSDNTNAGMVFGPLPMVFWQIHISVDRAKTWGIYQVLIGTFDRRKVRCCLGGL